MDALPTSTPVAAAAPNAAGINAELFNNSSTLPDDVARQLDELNTVAPESTIGEVFQAAFARQNTVGSFLASDTIGDILYGPLSAKPMHPEEVLAKAKEDGVVDLARFAGIETDLQYANLMQQINDEQENRMIIHASGWTGFAAEMIASAADPINAIPGVASRTMAMRGAGLLTTTAAAAGESAILSELALQGTQNTRTWDESATNIGGSVIVGGLIGAGVHKLMGRDPDVLDMKALESKVADSFHDHRQGSPQGSSAGAAYVGQYQQLRDRGLLDTARAPGTFGMDTLVKELGKPFEMIPGGVGEFVGLNLRNPVLDLSDSPSASAREAVDQLAPIAWISKRNVKGAPNALNVQAVHAAYQGQLAQFLSEFERLYKDNRATLVKADGKPMTRDDFSQAVYRAAVHGDDASDILPQGAATAVNRASISGRKVLDAIKKQLVENGKLPADAGDNLLGAKSYAPRRWNRVTVQARKAEFLDMIKASAEPQLKKEAAEKLAARDSAYDEAVRIAAEKGEKKPRKPPALRTSPDAIAKALDELAADTYAKIVGNDASGIDIGGPITGTRGYFKGRKIDIEDRFLADNGWIESDFVGLLESYVRHAGMDAAIGKIFKKKITQVETVSNPDGSVSSKTITKEVGDDQLETVLSKIEKEFDELLSLSKGPRDEAKIVRDKKRAINSVRSMRDLLRGTYLADSAAPNAESSSAFRKATEVVGSLNYLRLLGNVTLGATGDIAGLVVANGLGRTLRNGIVPMLTDFTTAYRSGSGEFRRQARLAGAVMELEFNSRLAGMSEIVDPLHGDRDHLLRFMRNSTKVFSKLNGMVYWNQIMKQTAYNITQARIADSAMQGPNRISKVERAWLANLGIDAIDDLSRIKEAIEGQAEQRLAGIPYLHHESWTDIDLQTKVKAALYNESLNTIVTPAIGDKPVFASTPTGRLLFQFKGFMLSAQSRMIARNMQLAKLDDEGSKRNAVYIGLLGLAGMQVLIDGIKRGMSENDADFAEWQDRWQKNPGASAYRVFETTGFYGPLVEGSSMIDSATGGAISLRSIASAGDTDPAFRGPRRSVGEAFGGPTGGLLETGARVGAGLATALTSGEKPTASTVHGLRTMMPFQNLPLLSQILNDGEKAMQGDPEAWFPPLPLVKPAPSRKP
jgi:hypothetical protein